MNIVTILKHHRHQSGKDNRAENRFPCVGIELIYSPTNDGPLDGLAHPLLQAVSADISLSGMAFDVDRPLEINTKLFLMIANQTIPNERLVATVMRCEKVADTHYRIGVQLDSSEGVISDSDATLIAEPIGVGSNIPREIEFSCPSCSIVSKFRFIANQQGHWGEGILPLYNCLNCGTTRTILSILSFNRSR